MSETSLDIYLDNSATTPVDPAVREAMLPYLGEAFANPSSLYTLGQKVRADVEEARRQAAHLVGAEPGTIVFTSGGTESDNLALLGVVWARKNEGRHLITSTVEHYAVGQAMSYLEKEGFTVTWLPVDRYGLVNVADFAAALRPDTILASIMHANNEVGTIQDITAMAAIARQRGVTFHTDAVQSAGKIVVDVEALGVDVLSFSSHKIHGPKGVGALYLRPGTPFQPMSYGGHQERGRRSGTENVPGIIGFGTACRLAAECLSSFNRDVGALRDAFEHQVLTRVSGAVANGTGAPRVPSISNIAFPGTEAEAVVISLDIRGVAASAGAACSSSSLEPSPVLKAMGLAQEILHGSVRFSFSRFNTANEASAAALIVIEVVDTVRQSMGPC